MNAVSPFAFMSRLSIRLLFIFRLSTCWVLFVCLALVSCGKKDERPDVDISTLRSVAPVPANPGLSPTARELLKRLAEHYGKNTLSGQVDYQEKGQFVAAPYVESVTGQVPVILGLDLMEYSPSRLPFAPPSYDVVGEALRVVTEQRRVLSLNWHWNAPMHLINNHKEPWSRGHYTAGTEFNLRAALKRPESAEYQALLRDIDAIGEQLKRLKEADIPVLWRPLHAAEGGWFWWGARGPEAFKELWRLMFVRLTDHHGLNNLIWVLTNEDPEWYPGDDVVDILGIDAYPSDRADTLLENWQALLKKHNGRKMIALTEFGGVPNIDNMQKAGVWFSFFISWTDQNRGKLGPMSVPQDYLSQVYQSLGVVTLSEWTGIRNDSAEPAAPLAEP